MSNDTKQAREMFAAFALSGLLANEARYANLVINQSVTVTEYLENSAWKAFAAADEMMKLREE